MPPDDLRFDRPAERWVDALPLGNGHLGVMVHGGIDAEHLQVNDATAWSGSPASEHAAPVVDAATAREALAAARAAVAAQDFEEADQQVRRLQHRHTQAYLPFADVRIASAVSGAGSVGATATAGAEPVVTGYRRGLDLATACSSVRYLVDGYEVRRRVVVSHPHDVAVLTIQTDHPHGLDLSITLGSPLRVVGSGASSRDAWLTLRTPADVWPRHDAGEDPVRYSADPAASMAGAVALSWTHDGADATAHAASTTHGVTTATTAATGVRTATVVLSTRTTFAGLGVAPVGSAADALAQARARVSAAVDAGVGQVLREQQADHGGLYDRVRLHLGRPPTADGPTVDLPTDERLRRAGADPRGPLAADPALAALLYDLGRYLLLSSSRPGGPPATLQGIWNDQLPAPWSANYTTNINLEMNYWPAEVSNLSELTAPLFDLIDALAVTGAATAQRLYGAPGWVAHHNTDAWAYSQPVGAGRHDPKWAFWPLAGPWLVRHLGEHLAFGADDAFARRAWPPVRSCAEFVLHWLVDLPDGRLGTSPSTSPENVFARPDGGEASVDASSTMDLALIADLLRLVATLAGRLDLADDDVVRRAAAALPRIPTPAPGRDGLVPEWLADRPQPDPTHRHLSHLSFAFPGDRPLSPALHAAVSGSLDARGDEATGWSLAWKVALRARLRQPAKVGDLLRLVFRAADPARGAWSGGLYPNLFAAHPPFQIDGNLGYVAGLTECLLQSHAGAIELLPSLPAELASGSVTGLVARPGVAVSLRWEPDAHGAATLVQASFRAIRPPGHARHRVVWAGREVSVDLAGGGTVTLDAGCFVAP